MQTPILSIRDLAVRFKSMIGDQTVIEHLDLDILPGEILGLVGESGSGKSVTGLSVMGLLPAPHGKISAGKILFGEKNLVDLDNRTYSDLRGKKLAMIFQEPMTSLNPVFRIGEQIEEVLAIHEKIPKKMRRDRVIELLKQVRIPNAEKVYEAYPHQLSGGMRQRVMIAMALCLNPELLVADEPTTALDVTIQAQILDIMQQVVESRGISILFITHDLSVIAQIAHRVAVMYAGQIVESGPSESILRQPRHPYTEGLIQARPENYQKGTGYYTIPGMVPSSFADLPGCRFCARCTHALERCNREMPELICEGERLIRCFNPKGRD